MRPFFAVSPKGRFGPCKLRDKLAASGTKLKRSDRGLNHRRQCVNRLLGLDKFHRGRSDPQHIPRRVAEEMRRPDPAENPALIFKNPGAENVPFDDIIRAGIPAAIAEQSDGDITWPRRMMKREIDAESFVAPVNIGADFWILRQRLREVLREHRR
jgi:hypothetical protein